VGRKVKEDEEGGSCSMKRDGEKCTKNVVRKPSELLMLVSKPK
jgi:hypothetical protein